MEYIAKAVYDNSKDGRPALVLRQRMAKHYMQTNM